MITVYIDRQQDYQQIVVAGHAGYAEHGKDIVCAGASAITCALMNMAVEANDGALVKQNDGFAFVYLKGPETERVTAILDTVQTGYEAIEAQYPDYLHILHREGSQ